MEQTQDSFQNLLDDVANHPPECTYDFTSKALKRGDQGPAVVNARRFIKNLFPAGQDNLNISVDDDTFDDNMQTALNTVCKKYMSLCEDQRKGTGMWDPKQDDTLKGILGRTCGGPSKLSCARWGIMCESKFPAK
jgi:hypothetical protein